MRNYYVFTADWRSLAKEFWEGSGGKAFETGAMIAFDNDCPIKEGSNGEVVRFALNHEMGTWIFRLICASKGWIGNPNDGPVPVKIDYVPEDHLSDFFK